MRKLKTSKRLAPFTVAISLVVNLFWISNHHFGSAEEKFTTLAVGTLFLSVVAIFLFYSVKAFAEGFTEPCKGDERSSSG